MTLWKRFHLHNPMISPLYHYVCWWTPHLWRRIRQVFLLAHAWGPHSAFRCGGGLPRCLHWRWLLVGIGYLININSTVFYDGCPTKPSFYTRPLFSGAIKWLTWVISSGEKVGAGSAYWKMICISFTTFLRYKIMVPFKPVMYSIDLSFNKHLENNAL